jgi:hypothetical protein
VRTSNSTSGSECRHQGDQADGECMLEICVGMNESGHIASEVFNVIGLGHTSRSNRIIGRQPRHDSV